MTCQSHSRRNSLPPSPSIHCPVAGDRLAPARPPKRTRHGAFTLIEMLVALAITLIMMGAVVSLFGVISESVSKSRSMIEISDRLRAAREIIQQDLQGATATFKPPLSPENDQGYFEILEGINNDGSVIGNPVSQLFGDVDDVLMFTTSNASPFLGKYTPTLGGTTRIMESKYAEVIYFLVQDGPTIDATTTPATKLCTLYRRVLLVNPSVPQIAPSTTFYTLNDLSVRYATPGGTPTLIPNTLGDLTKRENRFAHYSNATLNTYGQFPFRADTSIVPQIPYTTPTVTDPSGMTNWPTGHPTENAVIAPFASGTARFGEDTLLTNVIGFDVQVFDPGMPIWVDTTTGVTVEPNAPDSAFLAAATSTPVGFGGYADVAWNRKTYYTAATGNPVPQFGALPTPGAKTGFTATSQPAYFDTWSVHYENDGIDNDGDGNVDFGSNGLDDNNNGLIDELAEWDTQPPYTAPLRGIRITLRVYEPSSQQVREAVIVQNFDSK